MQKKNEINAAALAQTWFREGRYPTLGEAQQAAFAVGERLDANAIGAKAVALQQAAVAIGKGLRAEAAIRAARVLARSGPVPVSETAIADRALAIRHTSGADLGAAQVTALRETREVGALVDEDLPAPTSPATTTKVDCYDRERAQAREIVRALRDRTPRLARAAQIAVVGARLQRDGCPRTAAYALAAEVTEATP